MAFARPSATRPPPVQRHRHEHVPPPAPEPKVAMLKDLRKLRKALNEKVEHALELKGDITSVHQQLRSIGDAFDTLSQVLVDELDFIKGDVARTKVDMVDQLTALARGVQEMSPELASMQKVVDNCVTSCTTSADTAQKTAEGAKQTTHKLKHWSESGFRRLNEAMTVQQQALSVLDGQVMSVQEEVKQVGGDIGAVRQDIGAFRQEVAKDVAQRGHEQRSESDKLRQELALARQEAAQARQETVRTRADFEGMVGEYRQQLSAMQAAAANYEIAMADRETRAARQLQDYARAEAEMQDLRAMFDSRLTALEKSWRRDMPKAGGLQAEGRVKDLEFEVGQLKRLATEQGDTIRDLQRQINRAAERPLAQSRAEQQQLQDLVSKAVHEHMVRTNRASLSLRPGAGGMVVGGRDRGGSPLRETDFDGDTSALASPGVVGGALERAMAASQRRVGAMKHESEQRHAALTRAVEEIDERIRAAAS